ncbi:MAG: FeoB small GTPase domain-containing protein, partial [Verrucomicrobiales bacterium]
MEKTLETVALAGNPNAGKTTLFNALCGTAEKVGNYSGVTVSVKKGEFYTPHGRKLSLIDLPGSNEFAGDHDHTLAAVDLAGDGGAPDPDKAILLPPALLELAR